MVVLLVLSSERNLLLTLGGHLLCFFVIAMACHGELARTRPATTWLTGFYVALSLGGMIGGLFAGLIAPYTFSWIAEYPILLVLAVLCRPAGGAALAALEPLVLAAARHSSGAVVAPSCTAAAACSPGWTTSGLRDRRGGGGRMVLACCVWRDRLKLAVIIALALVLIRLYPADDGRVETVRCFFGVHKIVVTPNGQYHVLLHGTTIHGAEKCRNDDGTPVTGRPEPITYYHEDGGIGQAITAMRERKGGPLRVAVIGLGSGTLTCASQPGEDWKFFEIDQTMVDTARDPKYFTYIQQCEPDLQAGDRRRAADLRAGSPTASTT